MFARQHEPSQVEAFLRERFGQVTEVALIGSGEWSQAFSFRVAEGKRVVRFGNFGEDYEKDRVAHAFAGPELPIPQVHEIGHAFDGFFATSTFLEGVGFDEIDEAGYRRILPELFRSLDAIREIDVSSSQGFGIWPAEGTGPYSSWRETLLDIRNDRAGSRLHGWRSLMEPHTEAVKRFDEGYRILQGLVEVSPEQRHLIHADLMADNLRVLDDRVSAVVDWANAMYGDFLYDLARLEFWRPWFPELAHIDFAAEALAHYDAIGLEVPGFTARLRCCQLHLGLEAQAYNAFTKCWDELEGSATRTLEIGETG